MEVLDTKRYDTKDIEPGEYIRLVESGKAKFASVEIVPPSLDDRTASFGKIRVRLSTPEYHVDFGDVK
jgi:hypothetical protein